MEGKTGDFRVIKEVAGDLVDVLDDWAVCREEARYLPEQLFRHRIHEGVTCRKVLVSRGPVDAGGMSDTRDREALEPALSQLLARRIEDAAAGASEVRAPVVV
jgi:hypothetical protein